MVPRPSLAGRPVHRVYHRLDAVAESGPPAEGIRDAVSTEEIVRWIREDRDGGLTASGANRVARMSHSR